MRVRALAVLLSAIVGLSLGSARVSADESFSSTDFVLQDEIQSYLEGLDGTYGVSVFNFQDGRMVAVNADAPLESASLYKLLVAYRVLTEAERGNLSLDDEVTISEEDAAVFARDDDLAAGDILTVGDALSAMITVSSNSAAYALIRTSGGWSGMAQAADELGITLAEQDDQIMVSPADYTAYFRRLVGGSLLSRDYAEKLLTLLLGQQVNDRLPALLPPDTKIAHKTGELDDVRNDAGVVFGLNASYVVVLMANNVAPADATEVEATISRMIYDRYDVP